MLVTFFGLCSAMRTLREITCPRAETRHNRILDLVSKFVKKEEEAIGGDEQLRAINQVSIIPSPPFPTPQRASKHSTLTAHALTHTHTNESLPGIAHLEARCQGRYVGDQCPRPSRARVAVQSKRQIGALEDKRWYICLYC